MRKMVIALVLVVVACLTAVSVSTASSGPIQVSGQSADTSQQAAAGSSATQTNPSNTNISIRVLSPGNDGNVSQTNAAGSTATAGNTSNTAQGSGQSAGSGGVQSSTQSSTTDQLAGALSTAAQSGASNVNVPIRVLSPGNDGNVSQTNAVGSQATAGNTATTGQTGTQSAAGGGSCGCESSAPIQTSDHSASGSCGCDSSAPIQTSDQSASTDQHAGAASQATQIDPSNTAVSVRVLSPGDGGSVSQTNAVGSTATAGNQAATTQSSQQAAAAAVCGCSGTSVQQADQSATTDQGSAALSAAAQASPSNEASPVRVHSDGNGGAVDQQNLAASHAAAGNTASTTQQGSQVAGTGNPIQIASQDASTDQGALAASAAEQLGASNDASPVRVKSDGNDGSVSQANSALSSAAAGNTAGTSQTANQTAAGGCGCSGTGIQVLGQQSDTKQAAFGASEALQKFGERSPCGCGGSSGNTASPVRVDSAGDDGTTSQANAVLSSATALNGASTTQNGSQTEAGGGLQIQALGQEAATEQVAAAASFAAQLGASNDASPVRVKSPGGGGSVQQANTAGSTAQAGNNAATSQAGWQAIAGRTCGCSSLPIQVAGQSATTKQAALALSAVLQAHPSNQSSPTSVWSPGGGGAVSETNAGLSLAGALNLAWTGQGVVQTS